MLHNQKLHETKDALLSPGQVGFMNGWGVFSTLRVAKGVLFAFERHFRRMRRDADLLRVPFCYEAEELSESLLKLVEANRAFDATLRVAVVRNKGNLFQSPGIKRETDLIAFTADLTRWPVRAKLGYMPNARFGACPFAGTKVTSWAQNLAWYETAHARGLDEFVLLNEDGRISECTSANIFIIRGDQVLTPPITTSGCLPGVTRAILLEEIDLPAVRFSEAELSPSDLEEADQVFICSTTRELLPVGEIDGEPLKQNPELLQELQQAFTLYQEKYISTHSSRTREPLAV
ncbi:MAG: aminotransferase class IV [Acidobacteriaceae bacterium]|nr:aminotransferase class IV [Acidobacteriaceae bacterium]MBV8570308.1 aminotransferase class IV [Acidobacteriaceae bacterium]